MWGGEEVCARAHMCAQESAEVRRRHTKPEAVALKLNSDPVKEQHVLLNGEPSLQSPKQPIFIQAIILTKSMYFPIHHSWNIIVMYKFHLISYLTHMASHLHFLTHGNAWRVNGAGGSIQNVEASRLKMRIDGTCQQCNVSGLRRKSRLCNNEASECWLFDENLPWEKR